MDTVGVVYPVISISKELSDKLHRLGISLFLTNLLPGFLKQGVSYVSSEVSDAYYSRYEDDELGVIKELTELIAYELNLFCILNPHIRKLIFYDLKVSVDMNLGLFTLIVDLNSDIRGM